MTKMLQQQRLPLVVKLALALMILAGVAALYTIANQSVDTPFSELETNLVWLGSVMGVTGIISCFALRLPAKQDATQSSPNA